MTGGVAAALVLAAAAAATVQPAAPSTARWMAWHNDELVLQALALAQTSDGFLWIGTESGLVRFDGLEMKPVKGVSGEVVDALASDASGALWVGAGARLLKREGARLRELARLPAEGEIRALLPPESEGGTAWLAAGSVTYRWSAHDGLSPASGLERGSVFGFLAGHPGHPALAASTTGVKVLDGERWRPLGVPGSEHLSVALARDRNAVVWMGGIALRSLAAGAREAVLAVPASRVRTIRELSNGELWVGTHGDGLHIRGADGAWRRGDRRLRGEIIKDLLEDRESNIWVATAGGGLHRFALDQTAVVDVEDGLPSKLLASVAEDADGRLWVATYGEGLVRMDANGDITAVRTPCGQVLNALLWEPPDTLWVGGAGGLCAVTEGVARRVGAPDPVEGLAPASRGFWVLGNGSLTLVVGRRSLTSVRWAGEPTAWDAAQVLDGGDGTAWLATSAGLLHATAAGLQATSYRRQVTSMLRAGDGELWLVGEEGLTLVRRDGTLASTPTLPDAWLLLDDASDGLWAVAPAGVARHPATATRVALAEGRAAGEPLRLASSDGYPGARGSGVGMPSSVRLRDGRVAFVAFGQVHLAWLRLDEREPPQPPAPVIEVDAPGVHAAPDQFRFAPGQQPLSLRFTVAAFRNPAGVWFRRRLRPLDEDWSAPAHERAHTYGRLPPGAYELEVEASVAGAAPARTTRHRFSIAPRWHESALTRTALVLGMVLLAAAVAATGQRLRIRRLRERQRELEMVVAARTAELSLANEQLLDLARTDALTGVANRRHFRECYEAEWRRARREGTCIAVLMVDVDHFKAFNDCYGHGEGDACLRRVAEALARAVRRPGEMLARYGGEEFVAMLPRATASDAGHVAEAMREGVKRLAVAHAGNPGQGVVTVSVGAASAQPADGDLEALLAAADAALYRAKQEGRDRIVIQS